MTQSISSSNYPSASITIMFLCLAGVWDLVTWTCTLGLKACECRVATTMSLPDAATALLSTVSCGSKPAHFLCLLTSRLFHLPLFFLLPASNLFTFSHIFPPPRLRLSLTLAENPAATNGPRWGSEEERARLHCCHGDLRLNHRTGQLSLVLTCHFS